MDSKELSVQLYLHERESINGEFFIGLINANKANREYFTKARQPLTAERFNLTPQEELFAKFFGEEKQLVHDMDTLTLRAHREELSKIAFEARARLTATDDELKTREKKPREHRTALQADELTTNAINAIKNRGVRQTKEEKALAGLLKMGVSQKDAEAMLSAGNVLARLKSKDETVTPSEVNPSTAKFVNPFAVQQDIDRAKAEEAEAERQAKEERKQKNAAVEVSMNEETNTVVVTKTEEPVKPAFTFNNPFAK